MNHIKRAFFLVGQSLAHPISLTAATILLLNATLLQPIVPSWLTGKLGDIAWMIIAPLLIAGLITCGMPGCSRHGHQLAGLLAAGLVGAGFAAVKTIPWVNHTVGWLFFDLTGTPAKLILDPTDLLALPGLWVSLQVWQRAEFFRPSFAPLRKFGLVLAAIALLADAPAPLDLGIGCLTQTDREVYALRGFDNRGSEYWTAYRSTDGGLTWAYAQNVPADDAPAETNALLTDATQSCGQAEATWVYASANDSQVSFIFMGNEAIYRSADGGDTYQREVDLTGVTILDALTDRETGNLVTAAGPAGVIVYTPQGDWQTIGLDDLQ